MFGLVVSWWLVSLYGKHVQEIPNFVSPFLGVYHEPTMMSIRK